MPRILYSGPTVDAENSRWRDDFVEAALKDNLSRVYPAAPEVDARDLDGKFVLLLERMAELNLDGKH